MSFRISIPKNPVGLARKAGVSVDQYKLNRRKGLKFCSRCSQWHHFELHQKDPSKADGRSVYCSFCKESGRKNQAQRIYRRYKHSAARRNIPFQLNFNSFMEFWQQSCFYCGNPIATTGIDRLNNNLGYVIGNCVPCCGTCNMMKKNHAVEEWLQHVKRITENCFLYDQV